MLEALHDPANGPMRAVALMSGSGTNLCRILEQRREMQSNGACPYEICAIFSDDFRSNASAIGESFDIPVITRDIRAFYRERGLPRSDLSIRPDFDRQTVKALAPFEATVAIYAGYMSIVTPPIIEAYAGINVHPADLSVLDEDGNRRYTGAHGVLDAIIAGEKYIHSSTHLVENEVDGGRLMMISAPLAVELPDGADFSNTEARRELESHNQEKLKEAGDWVVFPRTLLDMAEGRYTQDENGLLHYDGRAIPGGMRL